MKNNNYEKPVLNVIVVENEDVIATSAFGQAQDKSYGDFWNADL